MEGHHCSEEGVAVSLLAVVEGLGRQEEEAAMYYHLQDDRSY